MHLAAAAVFVWETERQREAEKSNSKNKGKTTQNTKASKAVPWLIQTMERHTKDPLVFHCE